MDLAQFLTAISIEGAGEITFELMIKEGYNTIEKINDMTIQQIAEVGKLSKKTIGEKTATRIWNSLHSDRVKDILEHINLWIEESIMDDVDVSIKGTINKPVGYPPDKIPFIGNRGKSFIVSKNKNIYIKDKVNVSDSLNINIEEDEESELKIDLKGKKVIFTGKGPFSRETLTTVLKRNGAIVQPSIRKDTEVLILADLDSSSTKAKKARKWGTKMVTYGDVFKE